MKKIKNFILTLAILNIFQIHCLFFELEKDSPHCFLEEFLDENIVLIKFKLYDLNVEDSVNMKLAETIVITVAREIDDIIIARFVIRQLKSKYSFTISKTGIYKFCLKDQNSEWFRNRSIKARLFIDSDNSEHKDITKAVKQSDIHNTKNLIFDILNRGDKLIRLQKFSLDDQNSISEIHIQYSKIFIFITTFQILIVILLGIYNLFSLRNFLISRNLI